MSKTILHRTTTAHLHLSRHIQKTRYTLLSTRRTMAAKVKPLSSSLPKGTWDSHMHVVEPDRFPLSATAKYTPKPHTLADARAFYKQLDIQNLVLVQPSIYGTDNSCLLEALKKLGPRHGRGVVELDPDTIEAETLREWHGLGVRGVRVNLVSVGKELHGEEELRGELQRYADVVRPLGWVLQLYVPMKLITALEKIAPELDAKLCVDHFGSPSLPSPYDPDRRLDPYSLDGFAALVRLLEGGKTWVKLSAPYRVAKDERFRDLDTIGRELVGRAPDQIIYATDWPHTRFEAIDSSPFVELCYEWCGEGTGLREKFFRRNAEVLWDVDEEERES